MRPVDTGPGTGRAFGDVVDAVVREVAPHELPVLDGLRELGHHTALRRQRRPGHDGLGFGLPEIVATLSPVLYVALDQALRKVVDLSVEGAARRAARKLLRRGDPPEPVVPPLTDEQAAAVRTEVLRALGEQELPPELRAAVDDALTRALPSREDPGDAGS